MVKAFGSFDLFTYFFVIGCLRIKGKKDLFKIVFIDHIVPVKVSRYTSFLFFRFFGKSVYLLGLFGDLSLDLTESFVVSDDQEHKESKDHQSESDNNDT